MICTAIEVLELTHHAHSLLHLQLLAPEVHQRRVCIKQELLMLSALISSKKNFLAHSYLLTYNLTWLYVCPNLN